MQEIRETQIKMLTMGLLRRKQTNMSEIMEDVVHDLLGLKEFSQS